MRAVRPLRARALEALSRREYSRTELAGKLRPHAVDADEIDSLLAELEHQGLLSDARFAESLVHRRAPRHGTARIAMEMAEHGLSDELVDAQRAELAATEYERCRAVWQRKFGVLPASFPERARQTRFLLARGFDAAVIRRVVKGNGEA